MALPENIISDFEDATNYRLSVYLNKFTDFISRDRVKVLNYYSGNTSTPSTAAFDNLNYLVSEKRVLNGVIEGNRNLFRNGKYWELIETLSDIETAIETIDNSSKWLRSAISKGNFSPTVEVERVLRQFQTVEDVSRETGANDVDSGWLNIALRNDLREEDYTPRGGNVLKIIGSNKFSIRLNTVVDNISGKKVYGIDIARKITFSDNDLLALGYDDTVRQTVAILSNLKKGATPEFPEDGIQASLVTGATRASIAYPILTRQYFNTFAKDDTLKSLKITNIRILQDSLSIDLEVETRLSEVLQEISNI